MEDERLIDLGNSVEYMTSDSYRKRFVAEYAQLVTRLYRLFDLMYDEDGNNIKLSCPIRLIDMQIECMEKYKEILEIRAEIENIDLSNEIRNLNSNNGC